MANRVERTIPLAEKLLLSAQEVAVLTGLHPDDVYRLGADGTLPTLKINRRTKFPTAGIIRWIEENTNEAA